ncbi:S8 family serine peptidase [Clostridium senegalense]
MVNVAVIDDGVGLGIYSIPNIIRSVEITPHLIVKDVEVYNLFNASHGTICASIIKKYYPEAVLTSIKVLNDKSHKCIKEQLIKAIEWCIENDIRVVNLSLGTIDYRDSEIIRKVINRAYSRGIIIIAACNNRDIFTYPASFTNVIGVKCSKTNTLKEGEYIFNLYSIDGIEITACSEHKLFKNNCDSEVTRRCNSYAAPMITAKTCNIISKFPNITLEMIKKELYKDSINYKNDKIKINNCKNIDWINNVVILDEQEKIEKLKLPYINETKILKSIEDININNFDTLVLNSNTIKDYERMSSLIYKFEKEERNFIFTDKKWNGKELESIYLNENIKFWHPLIINKFYQKSKKGKKLDVPLIIIYGDIQESMLTILKSLIEKFKVDGYYALGVSTEPIGILCGLEYIPFSKNESSKIKNKIELLYDVYDFDIMILGININKEDANIIEKINICLEPDKNIFINKIFLKKEKNIDEVLTITKNDDIDLFYKKILKMFLGESE